MRGGCLVEPVVVRDVEGVRAGVGEARGAGRGVALVPTMGALHDGHLSLVRAAVGSGAFVVVSVYVNPTQFGPGEDFSAYPRTFEADRAACAAAGVEMIFAPTDAEMYPAGDQTSAGPGAAGDQTSAGPGSVGDQACVRPGSAAVGMCGACRPGHFAGVCTVVAKLFNIVQPDVAYFGQKDAQQAVVIRQMVRDLRMPIRIEVCPLVREPDGLALSSRNARLSPGQRAEALSLYRALCVGRDRLRSGEVSSGRVIAAMRGEVMKAASVRIEYLSVVDPETLEPVAEPKGRVMVAGAVRVGETRLIDNLLVDL